MSDDFTLQAQQGLTANRQLKTLFDAEVKAVKDIITEHNLTKEFTPAGDIIVPVNISFAARAIVISRLLSGHWVGSIETVFEYALYNLKHNTVFRDIKIEIPEEQEQSTKINAPGDRVQDF